MLNRVAIITGGARGIGKEISKVLAQNGIKVIVNYNKSKEMAEKLKQELKKESISIDIVKADVSKRNEVKEMVNYILNKYGKIDILINNAGISNYKLFIDVTDEEWNNIINNNLYSVFCTTQEVLHSMIHNKNGCIINISSIWGMVGASCESIYSVSKAGIDAMTKSLAKELGPCNIRVNSIAPGIINTDMISNFSKEEINDIIQQIPLERIGKKTDIAKCIKWLIDDEYTTGQVISINGGWIIN